ncbi:MAG: FMN-binding protein [Elusimicrobia bacterium]|nr:FMN-binding protein [Elusimicrobiota bacterium]
MKNFFRITFFLFAVCVVSGFLLSFFYTKSIDRIKENERKTKIEAIDKIFGNEKVLEKEVSGKKYWVVGDKGFAFEAKGMGFQDEIIAMIGVTKNFEIKGIVVLKCLDTPGLGAEVAGDKFLNQFKGKSAPFEVVRNIASGPHKIQAVTGATISSKAFVKMVNSAIKEMKKKIKK